VKRLILTLVAVLAGVPMAYGGETVVVYTSVDQIFSEPVLREFERQSGITVKPVFDVEASKTTGLVNRLIAEKKFPRADVFWNSEVGRTLVLKEKGVLAPYHSPSAETIPKRFKDEEGYWTGFGARARVLIYNTDLLEAGAVPRSVFDLTRPQWRGKVAMAYPLFGTAATHVAAWYALLGRGKAEAYLTALKNNGLVIVDGNAVARDLVVRGEVPVAFTDTDDVYVAIRAGRAVDMVFPDQDGIGTLLIPNTVALIRNGPHPDAGRRLIDYLLSEEVGARLAASDSMQIPVRTRVKSPSHAPPLSGIRAMSVDYRDIAKNLEPAARFSRHLFSR